MPTPPTHSPPRVSAIMRWAERLNTRFWKALARAAEDGTDVTIGTGSRLIRLLRILVLAALSFTVNEVPLRASALVFTTLLAFIPLAIILSSVAGWMGYLDLLQDAIPYFLGSLNLDLPLDPLMRALSRAESIGFHQLGLMGTLGLMIGFGLSMSSVEEAMNRVWNVRTSRNWLRRITRYAPFLALLAVAVLITVLFLFRLRRIFLDWGFDGILLFPVPGGTLLFGSIGLLFFLWVLMVLMIRLLPNTNVRLSRALLGATAGIVPLYFVSRLLLLFPALFMERNQLFYGSLVVIPVALLLIYAYWVCALFGCAVAFVQERLQHDAGRAFFTRGAGLMEDWDDAVREIEDIYRRPSRPKPDAAPEDPAVVTDAPPPKDDPPT